MAANGEGPALDLPRRRRLKRLIRIAWALRDLPWLPDEQAAAFLVSTGPLIERTPLTRGPGGDATVQFGLPAVDALGLLKVHVLGWEPLRLLRDAVRAVRAAEDPRFSPGSLPPDGARAIAAILRNQPAAMPDLLYPAERELALRLGTRTLADLALAFALHSPLQAIADTLIARRQGLEPPEPPHPLLADILGDTHGLFVFREQQLQAIQHLTGWSALETAGRHRPTAQPRVGLPDMAAFAKACWKKHRIPNGAAGDCFSEVQAIRPWKAETLGRVQLASWLSWLSCRNPLVWRRKTGS